MSFPRSSGLLLHPTSLAGRFGIGDLGPSAFEFIDLLSAGGQRVWQVLPFGPTGYCDSPYQSFSAFAGNPLLISLEDLQRRGLLNDSDLHDAPRFDAGRVDYENVIGHRRTLWPRVLKRFDASGPAVHQAFDEFCSRMQPGSTTLRCSWRSRMPTITSRGRGGKRTLPRGSPQQSRDGRAAWRERFDSTS